MSLDIALDLDDVVLDFVNGLVNAVNTEFNVGLRREQVNQFDLHPILDPLIGESWWSWMRRRDWLWENFGAVPGAIGGIEHLRRTGHYVEIVTSKPAWAEYSVWRWLGKWRPRVNRVTIVDMDTPKSRVSDAPLLVDDKPSNVDEWVESDNHRRAILFDRPHNQGHKLGPRQERALNWKRVLELIEDLEEGRW